MNLLKNWEKCLDQNFMTHLGKKQKHFNNFFSDENSQVYRLLCDTIQRKLYTDAKSTRTMVSKTSERPPHVNKSLLGENKSISKSLKSEGQNPRGKRNSKTHKDKTRGMGKVPRGFMKTLNTPNNKTGVMKENSERYTHQEMNGAVSKKSNLTIYTNNTLASNMSPNSNLSYSTLKSTSKSKKKPSSIRSGLTNNSRKTGTNRSQKNSTKFPMNSNFLNRLKKKTKNISNSIYSRNSRRSKKSQINTPLNTSEVPSNQTPTSNANNLLHVTLNSPNNHTHVVQINNFMHQNDKSDTKKRKPRKSVNSKVSKTSKASKNSHLLDIMKERKEKMKSRYYQKMKEGGFDDTRLKQLINTGKLKNLNSSKYKYW